MTKVVWLHSPVLYREKGGWYDGRISIAIGLAHAFVLNNGHPEPESVCGLKQLEFFSKEWDNPKEKSPRKCKTCDRKAR